MVACLCVEEGGIYENFFLLLFPDLASVLFFCCNFITFNFLV